MAVGTQRTGVNLRVKVACSHMPTFVGTRGHTRSAWTGHNEGRSESRNVFRRLGRGADLRDTLNRRQDQERSQHSTAQRRRQKVNSRGQRDIPIEDFHRTIVAMEENDEELIVEVMWLPFNWEIREAKLPKGLSSWISRRIKESQTLKTIWITLMISWNYTYYRKWPNAKCLLLLDE